MDKLSRREVFVVVVLLVMLTIGLIPALQHARREQRDGVRRDEVRKVKTALEMYYNEHEAYPVELSALRQAQGKHEYVVTESAGSRALAWYVRARLENASEGEVGFDEEHNVYYRVVSEGGRTYFDVCGGTATCGAPTRPE